MVQDAIYFDLKSEPRKT